MNIALWDGGEFIKKRPIFYHFGSKMSFTFWPISRKIKLLWKNGFQIWKVDKIIFPEAVNGFSTRLHLPPQKSTWKVAISTFKGLPGRWPKAWDVSDTTYEARTGRWPNAWGVRDTTYEDSTGRWPKARGTGVSPGCGRQPASGRQPGSESSIPSVCNDLPQRALGDT